MIDQLVKKFNYLDRDIRILTWVLRALFLVLVFRAASLIYEGKYDELWLLIAPTITLLAALIVTSASNRLIVNNRIDRLEDQNREIIRITHHLIAVCRDLTDKIHYVKAMLGNNNTRPSFILDKITNSIENRYELLFHKDNFKYLPRNCVDIITGMSGSIYGMRMLAEGIKHVTLENPLLPLSMNMEKSRSNLTSQLDKVLDNIENLVNELFKLRESIEVKKN